MRLGDRSRSAIDRIIAPRRGGNIPMRWMAFLILALSLPNRSDAASPAYPATPRDSVIDDYHGIRVADPYRWLENLDSPRTAEWSKAESRLTRDDLRDVPERDSIRSRLMALAN